MKSPLTIVNYSVTDLVPEKEKLQEDYLKGNMNKIIDQLLYEKEDLKKAYNYYNGIMDREQAKAIEEHYGISNPTTIDFIPLIRRHIDTLVGEFLRNVFNPRVTCKDDKTLREIERTKQLEITSALFAKAKAYNTKYANYIVGAVNGESPPGDPFTEATLDSLIDGLSDSYVSQYEQTAQDVVNYLIQSRTVDAEQKLKRLFIDLLVTGTCCYRVYIDEIGNEPQFEVCNPLDVFFYKNNNDVYINSCNRVLYRRYMSRQDILYKWGHLLSETDKETIMGLTAVASNGQPRIIKAGQNTGIVDDYGTHIDKLNTDYFMYNDIFEVYEVEWIADNYIEVPKSTVNHSTELGAVDAQKKFKSKSPSSTIKRYRQDRYRGVRIGDFIYVGLGKDDTVIRSMDEPFKANLSFNGLSYSERNARPFSLVLQTAALQDKYNLLHYFRDSLIANSGTKGSYYDVSTLPEFLGNSAVERLEKVIRYKKGGIGLIDTSSDAAQHTPNTIFGGFDESVSGTALQAIEYAIRQIEETASAVTGVYRQALGNIEQRDAVSNVRVGINQSAVITRQYFQLIEKVSKEVFSDMLNLSKVTFKKGMKASYIMGNKQKIFTIDPNYFGHSDYDIHLSTTGEELQEAEYLKQFAMQMVKNNQADYDVVLDILTSNSISSLKSNLGASLDKKKKENDIVGNLTQQLEQYKEQAKQMQEQLDRLSKKELELKEREFALKEKEVLGKLENDKADIERKRVYDQQKVEEMEKRTEVEKIEAIASGKKKEVKNID